MNVVMDMPHDGTEHKYVTGLNKDGERVVIARSINFYKYHRNIVDRYRVLHGNLKDITGGYVLFEDGIYKFMGSSGDFGRADHQQVSAIVNRGSEPARKYHAEKEAARLKEKEAARLARLKELDDTRKEERKERVKRIAKEIGDCTIAAAILILTPFGLYKGCSAADDYFKESVKSELVEIEAIPESVESNCYKNGGGTYTIIADVDSGSSIARRIIAESHPLESCTKANTVEALVNKEIRDGDEETIKLTGKYSDSETARFIVYSIKVDKHRINFDNYNWSD